MWRYWISLAIGAFCLNWPWEMLQMQAYREMADRAWLQTVVPCTIATVGDVAITAAIYGLGILTCGDPRWVQGRWNAYLAIEWKLRLEGRWSYSTAMPVVPVLNVGLWPLLQLACLVPMAFGLAEWIGGTRPGWGSFHDSAASNSNIHTRRRFG